jgi:L-2,4-diaminobutyrate decarboxylase
MLGLGEDSIIALPVDRNRRIDLQQFKQTFGRFSEQEPFCFIATAGTTSTGSIDPIYRIHQICRDRGIWLHTDGAYGLAYSLIPEYKDRFKGVPYADSISWDPHKQMAVPIPNSILFLRKGEDFSPMALHSDYFNRNETRPNPGLKSPPSTRPLAALPLVASLLHLGLEKLIARLRKPLQTVEKVYLYLSREEDFRVEHKPDTGILCFTFSPPGLPEGKRNGVQRHIFNRILGEGRFSVSLTRLDERVVLRLLAISPRDTPDSMIKAVEKIREIGYAHLKG